MKTGLNYKIKCNKDIHCKKKNNLLTSLKKDKSWYEGLNILKPYFINKNKIRESIILNSSRIAIKMYKETGSNFNKNLSNITMKRKSKKWLENLFEKDTI